MQRKIVVRKSNKGNYEVDYFEGRKDKAVYHNLLNPDATQLAVVLMDLEISTSLPIFEAVKKYLYKRDSRDWLGL
jgi:hypothetical protein